MASDKKINGDETGKECSKLIYGLFLFILEVLLGCVDYFG